MMSGPGEYSWEWADLRRLHRRMLWLAVAGAAVFALVPVDNYLDNYLHLGPFLFLVWAVSVVTFFVTLIQHSYWPCPRCGEQFHHRRRELGNFNNPFANRCANCGLPKWAMSDPDPKLKQYYDPFRTDVIFKLGDSKRHRNW
jgi:predicted RNA-binding Zn-ribbon protein involved in translation (DUF1610 family)